ncbi:MAG TPA: tetratricopeptide repeat protein [Gemmatimonadaceae bacterium]|nr:tetratricopeptide repeat protein [Gemmatimonadaceae bacterium]
MNDTIETRWEQENEAGRLSFTDGDFARAEQSFLAAIREATKLGADNVRLASSLSNLGQLKYKQKDFAQAEALFHRALAIRERVLGPEHFGLVQNINNLAALHYARNELDQAEPLFQRALGISQQHLGEAHPDVAVTLNNLARLYFRRNEYASAGPLLERLLSIKEQALGASHPEIAAILTSLAKVRLHQQDYDSGEAFARRALEIREKLKLPNDLAVATALETLADINGARGRIDEEIRHRERALEVRSGAMGPDHPLVAAARATLESRRAAKAQPPVVAPVVIAPAAPPAPPAPPVATQPPVSPPPSFTISPPPERSPRALSPPWVDLPDSPTFNRTPSPSVMRNSGSNAAIAMPPRNGNGNGRENGSGTKVATPASPAMESPLAFHPMAEARLELRPAPRISTPAASSAPQQAEPLADSPFTNSFARLVAETPASPSAIDLDASTHTHHLEEPRTEISLDWPLEPRRPWLKIAAAVVMLVLISGGGWYFLSRYDSSKVSQSKVAAAAATTKPPLVAARTDTLLVKHDGVPAGPPASVVKPGAVSQIVPSTKSSAADAPSASASSKDGGPPADAKHGAHTDGAASAPASDPDLIAAPKMPNVKVDAITKMIDDSARRRADSVGNVIQQKPPTFKPKPYKPPA